LKPTLLRRLRQGVQTGTLLLFLYILVVSGYQITPSPLTKLFFNLDPLVMLTSGIVARGLVAGWWLVFITLIVTLVWGRVWCGWFCPLGTLLEWITPPRPSKRLVVAQPPHSWRTWKFALLGLILVTALFGSQALIFLDPITILNRTMGSAFLPALSFAINQTEGFLYQYPFLSDGLDTIHRLLIYPLIGEIQPVFTHAVPIALLFIFLVALNWRAERFWCRYLCPLGGLLGLIARFALLRRAVGEKCSGCALCTPACPMDTINSQDNYQSDPAECTVCYDCIVACKREDVDFRWHVSGWKPAKTQEYDLSRRDALLTFAGALAITALAGTESARHREPAIYIRPPGARLTNFDALCIRCGACVRVCPTQGLQPTLFEGAWSNVFSPQLVPRIGYCSYPCNACGQVCPSGAIPSLNLEEKQVTPIGLARVDRQRCLPWVYDTPCIVCEEACPLPEKAIRLEQVQGSTEVLQRPYVVKELCIGCGVCEYQCPMGGEAAIRVFTLTEAVKYI